MELQVEGGSEVGSGSVCGGLLAAGGTLEFLLKRHGFIRFCIESDLAVPMTSIKNDSIAYLLAGGLVCMCRSYRSTRI